MRKRIFLYGFYGISNAGNEAMLNALIQPIRSQFNGNIEFIVGNRHPDSNYDKQYGVKSVPNLEYSSREKAKGRWLRGVNPDDTPEFIKLLKEIAISDLVIFGPGQYLVETGEYGLIKGSLSQFHTILVLSKLCGTPFYGLALSCEPLSSPWSILSINSALSACDCLTFRDPKSVENLEAAGIHLPKHEVLGDLALAAEPSDPKLASKALNDMNIPLKKGPRLAVAMRSIYWLGINQEKFRNKIADAISMWLKKWPDSDVLMIPQNVYNIDGNRDDDRVANADIFNMLPEDLKSRVHKIEQKFSPDITESFYSSADITLTTRLHGSVFSCKQGVPPIVFAFMDKTIGFFNRLGYPDRMVGLETDTNGIFNKLIDSYHNKNSLSEGILKSVQQIRKRALRYPAIAIELLEKNEIDNSKRNLARHLLLR